MALSEREQKLLEQMEQALYAEDPRFAARIRTQSMTRSRQRLIVGVVGILAGLGLVFLAVLNQVIWLGAVGFAVMVAAGVYGFAPAKKSGPTGVVTDDGAVQAHPAQGKKKRAGGTFMQRMEQRWDKRDRDQF